jgi:glycosyltransferase involved in cell wall biosynthesis
MCENGDTVHLVCQESHPHDHDFVAAAYQYDAHGAAELLFEREVAYDGRCVLHRPHVDVLPTYVRPSASITSMRCILDMAEEDIDAYLRYNEAALQTIVADHGLTVLHVNHVVLMATAVQRVSATTGVPFAVMPHGSAIEYVVRQEPRMHALAQEALTAARRIFVVGEEMRERVQAVFDGVPDVARKMTTLNLGVDTRDFQVLPRRERRESIGRLKQEIAEQETGRSLLQTDTLRAAILEGGSLEDLAQHLETARDYPPKRPDADLATRVDDVDWEHDDLLIYVGRLIRPKGVLSLLAALPPILAERPGVRVVIVGRGPLREVAEVFVWALASGQRTLARRVIEQAGMLEDETPGAFGPVQHYFEQRAADGTLDAYFEQAERFLTPGTVLFTGYLEHAALRHLYPCCDVAVIPSVVTEAGPLVFFEAMASGCFPMGTYVGGMGANIDVAAAVLPEEAAACMKLRPDPEHTVADIAAQVPVALDVGPEHREVLRRLCVESFDWRHITRRLTEELCAVGA